jgi:hypothetical protein
VIATSGDSYLFAGHLVEEPMLVGDPARPKAREVVPERFGLTDAVVAVTHHVRERDVDALELFSILRRSVSCCPSIKGQTDS